MTIYKIWSRCYDREGKKITPKEAKTLTFCHIRILFQEISQDMSEVLTALLKNVVSSPGEYACGDYNDNYGFTEVVIS